MKPLLVSLITMSCCLSVKHNVYAQTNEWNAATIFSNQVLSARLLFKPAASLADTNWLALELENHTSQPLRFDQIWVDLDSTQKEVPSGKVLSTGGLAGGTFPSIETLPPGRQRFYDDLASASTALGLAPSNGLQIEVQVAADIRLRDERTFKSPPEKSHFTFSWRQPSAAELLEMTRELKQILATPANLKKRGSRMMALFLAPQVRDRLTLDDYLPALQGTTDPITRMLFVPHLFAKYSNAPPVLAYYRAAFQKDPDAVYWDAADYSVWNEEFLEPLVRGCEQNKWHYFSVVKRHPTGWRDRPAIVTRLSNALFKHHPILSREVRQIPEKELEPWAKAVQEAGEVGDIALVESLKPALADRRNAPIDLGAGGVDHARVCDRALFAILNILDGNIYAAFQNAGSTNWNEQAIDEMITILQERLKQLPVRKKL